MNNHSLVRTQGTALHRQIFLVLRDGIVRGTYPSGTALPKEESLVELFGVARATVRRALADLEADGLVQRRHGTGTFVRDGLPSGAGAATLSYVDQLKETASNTTVRVVSVETASPPRWVSSMLDIPHDEVAIRAVRLRMAGDIPLMVTESWVPKDIGRSITPAKLRKQAMYEILLEQGLKFGRVVQEISAESADPLKADLLKCEISTALIRLTRLVHNEAGRPIQHLTAHLPPRHSRILMEIPGNAINTLSAGRIVHTPFPSQA